MYSNYNLILQTKIYIYESERVKYFFVDFNSFLNYILLTSYANRIVLTVFIKIFSYCFIIEFSIFLQVK